MLAGTEVTSRTLSPLSASASPALLEALPPFASLAAETRQRLIGVGVQREFAAGATIFQAGQQAAGLHVILDGHVRVLRARAGRQSVIHTEGPGGTLGEVPLFEGGVMPATAEAITATRCLIISGDSLTAIMRADPELALLFLRRLSARVRVLVERVDRLSTQSVLSRLAAFVLNRAERSSPSSFTLGMTQEELAEELGTVREVVVRGLARMRRDGLIATAGRGRFAVRDVAAIERVIGTA